MADLLPGTLAGRAALGTCLLLALAERVAESAQAAPGWASSHLDDLVCLPLVLGLVLAAHRAAGRPAAWRLPFAHGLVVAACFAVVFEVLLPHWCGGAIADPVDAAAYGLGLLVFHGVVNRPARGPVAGGRSRRHGSAAFSSCGSPPEIRQCERCRDAGTLGSADILGRCAQGAGGRWSPLDPVMRRHRFPAA